MNTASEVLLILAFGLFSLQVFMVFGWVAVMTRGGRGSVPFWPLLISVVLTVIAVLIY